MTFGNFWKSIARNAMSSSCRTARTPMLFHRRWRTHLIAAKYGISVDLVYDGEVSHPENLALIRVLEIELTRWTPEFEAEVYDGAIFVDNQAVNTALWPKLEECGVKPVAIVDHHYQAVGS